MISRKFYLIIIIRILLIMATSIWFSEAIRSPLNIYTIVVVVVLMILQVVTLLRVINTMNRRIRNFFDGIHEIGTSVRPHFKVEDKSFSYLEKSINRVAQLIQDARMRAEKQLKYFEFLVENNPVGMLIIDQSGKISQYNKAAKEILDTEYIFSLNDLSNSFPVFTREMVQLPLGGQKTIKTKINNVITFLLVKVSGIVSDKAQMKIVTIQNVTRELEENELASWQKLTRVLTHEINNAITPIISLTAASKRCLSIKGRSNSINAIDGENIKDAIFNIDLIEERSIGIKKFVNSYKRISQVPVIILKNVKVNEMIHRSVLSLNPEFKKNNISVYENYGQDIGEIELDQKLIGQVLTNIFINSIEAMVGSAVKKISIYSGQKSGNLWIEITDTGQGIPPDEIENIFTPFYTTKNEGMGIGLSLSRQIMQLHRGNIIVQSKPGKMTKFKLIF